MASKIQPEKKLRKKQVVINELAQVVAECYAMSSAFRELENKKYALQHELDKIIQQEVK